jgi:CheY-like chemotaxis protein
MSDSGISTPGQFSNQKVLCDKYILIVDDDPIFRRITRAFLESQGCKVKDVQNGLEGLIVLKNEDIDLVLCDLSMPVLNGMEFVEELSLSYPALPMIVVSATEAISDVAKVLKYGVKDFLPKPIHDYFSLMSSIVNVLDDSSSRQEEPRDFVTQWFRVDDGEIPEEKELHRHLSYLQNNPSAARELLHAIMPDNDVFQGDWRFNYRLIQSAKVMPLVFDYSWLMDGQFAFYVVDSGSNPEHGVRSSLLLRSLYHDYIRHLKTPYLDLKEIAEIIEKGVCCSTDHSGSVSALFGSVDINNATLSILPAGLDCQWHANHEDIMIKGGVKLGDNCRRNFITKDLRLGVTSQVAVNNLDACSFSLDIVKMLRS